MELLKLPFYGAIRDANTILLAGAGGGFDIFSGLPVYFALRNLGKTVHLANLSFTPIYGSTGKRHGEALVEVNARTEGSVRYFPEKYLCEWFLKERRETISIYCFDRTGVRPITTAYRNLVNLLGGVDAVILIDGGTDSLMRGDEPGLGTPEEDLASIFAVEALEDVATKLLLCIGFGIDTFHGVCHAYFLEAVAELTRQNAFLGAWSLLKEMPEAQLYHQAIQYVHNIMINNPSIVSTSILSAVEGRFGNYHANYRTEGSELFINPLMSLYWAFHLEPVAQRNLMRDLLLATESRAEVHDAIHIFRVLNQSSICEWKDLPM